MKKIKLLGVLFTAFVLVQSCSKTDCITCTMGTTTTDYCEKDYQGGAALSWSNYKATMIALGCKQK